MTMINLPIVWFSVFVFVIGYNIMITLTVNELFKVIGVPSRPMIAAWLVLVIGNETVDTLVQFS